MLVCVRACVYTPVGLLAEVPVTDHLSHLTQVRGTPESVCGFLVADIEEVAECVIALLHRVSTLLFIHPQLLLQETQTHLLVHRRSSQTVPQGPDQETTARIFINLNFNVGLI